MPWIPKCNTCSKIPDSLEEAREQTWLEAHVNVRPIDGGLKPKKRVACSTACMAAALHRIANEIEATDAEEEK